MMSDNEENLAILKDIGGGEIALKGVTIKGKLSGLLASVEVEQSYLNPQAKNIEAVYTFPLPIGAVLLGLEVEIDGRTLVGTVVERKKAERAYEDAVTDGNSAVMLEEAGPGLYTASLGNLMARETAVIRYRYALPLVWQGDRLRFLLPTTIAPRYGDALAAGLRPHQIPTSSLVVEYPLNLSIFVEGELAEATVACQSHSISMTRAENGIVVKLPANAVLDRDFVLTLESLKAQSSCVAVPDDAGNVVMASMRVPPVPLADIGPVSLKVVIDCSGSMGGTSIDQARKAALEILNELGSSDTFNITLFGSKHEHVFKGLAKATAKNITEAWERLERLDADMGGTEMESALDSVFSMGNGEGQSAVLLITDGEIHEHEKLVKRAAKSNHRVFVIGVGTSVAEAFLRSLSNATGGACELVAPQEGMAERVLSQFHRIRQPKLGPLKIEWPVLPTWETPLPETVFAGDTLHVFAGFPESVSGMVQLEVQGADRATASILSSTDQDIPRIAAAKRLSNLSEAQAAELAVKYQLLSKWTNFLVIAEREAKATDLPEIHKIPQMLAAGWGNTSIPAFSRKACYSVAACGNFNDFEDDIPFGSDPMPSCSSAARPAPSVKASMAYIPTTRRRVGTTTPKQFVERLEAAVFLYLPEPKLPATLAELEALDLDSVIADEIRKLIDGGYLESGLVIAFLNALAESGISDLFERNLKRHILKRWKYSSPGESFNQVMAKAVKDVTPDAWGVEVLDDQPF